MAAAALCLTLGGEPSLAETGYSVMMQVRSRAERQQVLFTTYPSLQICLSPSTLDKYYKYTQYTRIITKINFAECKKFPCLIEKENIFPRESKGRGVVLTTHPPSNAEFQIFFITGVAKSKDPIVLRQSDSHALRAYFFSTQYYPGLRTILFRTRQPDTRKGLLCTT